jgi:hypothetical protein
MVVNFKFSVDEKVHVKSMGLDGIVTHCCVDHGGVKYYVKIPRTTDDDWYYEDQIEAISEGEKNGIIKNVQGHDGKSL